MPQPSGIADRTIDKPEAPVARDASSSSPFAAWHWGLLVAGMIVFGGTNIVYPPMRTLSGSLGGVALALALMSRKSSWTSANRTDGIVAGIVLLFVLQLVPLPPGIWTQFPGRGAIAAVDREVFGQPLWRPITIDMEATWHTFAFLIPFLGAYLAFRSGDDLRRVAMIRGVWFALGLAVMLGLLQFFGLDFLHPFPIESDNEFGNGFFTNHNHQATFVLMAAALVIAHAPTLPKGLVEGRVIAAAIGVVLAVMASGSRSGVVLMALTMASTVIWWLAAHDRIFAAGRNRRRTLVLIGGVMVLGLFAVSALVISSDRFTLGRGALSEDQRLQMAPIAWHAIGQFWPLGSGFGTFQTPFRQVEPLEALRVLDIMHAHNDLLEMLIEGGLAALVLLVAMVIRIGQLARFGWRSGGTTRLRSAMTAWALLLPLLHSLVDYPLRTMAVSALFAMALAMFQPNASTAPETRA